MAREMTPQGRDSFEWFLFDNGWMDVGYSATYYPEWLKTDTYPHYERVNGEWRMKESSRVKFGFNK